MEYEESVFENAKSLTKKMIEKAYKNPDYRARGKLLEIAEFNKNFSFKEYILDIDRIDFVLFKECIHNLLVPANINIYILAGEREYDGRGLKRIKEFSNNIASVEKRKINTSIEDDAHIKAYSKTKARYYVVRLEFDNEIANIYKLFLLECAASLLNIDNLEIGFDGLDASIIFEFDEPKSYRDRLQNIGEQLFIDAKRKILTKYLYYLKNNPGYFAIKAGKLIDLGIELTEFMQFVDACDYKLFLEICNMSECQIFEAQIILGEDENE